MDQILFNDRNCATAIAQLAGTHTGDERYVGNICRVRDGEFIGGVLYYDYSGESVWAHTGALSPYWCNREMIFLALNFPFNRLKVKRMFGQVKATNDAALAFNIKVGLKVVATIPKQFRHGVDNLIMCLEREDAERLMKIRPKRLTLN